MASLWVKVGEGGLVPFRVEGYATEKDFQELLAANPEVLAGALDGPEAYLPPTANPSKFICVHLNSHQRSLEFGDHVGSRRGFGRVPMTCRNASGCCQYRRERRGP